VTVWTRQYGDDYTDGSRFIIITVFQFELYRSQFAGLYLPTNIQIDVELHSCEKVTGRKGCGSGSPAGRLRGIGNGQRVWERVVDSACGRGGGVLGIGEELQGGLKGIGNGNLRRREGHGR
jgi:hypothetical protein